MSPFAEDLLPDDLLDTFRERAEVHDRENTFPGEDLEDLRERGYLRLLVPAELGGTGASLLEAGRVQRRLARAAPATALAMGMHLVVTGAALHAHRRGQDSARSVLEDAAAGHLHAFGISEAGNDAMLFDSSTTAEAAPDGGYRLTGTKIFTSLAPAWDRLVVHGRVAEPTQVDPSLVIGVLERGDGIEVLDDWDTHGMRASQSRTTRLHGARIPSERVLTRTPVGPNADPFVMGVFGAFELLIASAYTGIAERAVTVGARIATTRRSLTTGIMHADDPDTRWRLADAAIGVDGAILQTEKLLADLDALGLGEGGVGITDHGARWFLHLSGVKSRSTETAIRAVDQVLRASGGAQYFRRSELERLSRDVRAGMYHPSDEESVHASYAKALLGEIGADRPVLPR
ncbi:acyl-CoA dehydrogenase family protein [Brachybacterium sp. YJGR34]|uniref:acyl-CoA dehydrogenase family protein n=1 Tax=Brachybacterium sp. YJGR34 TaxID=2059911 RepID=UPI000E0AA895|nr:acyl-CoA dehydrogenase family protein [Brachybacterium sp. YJGR34]